MARSNSTLATVLALVLGASAACTPTEPGTGGTGGSPAGTGGRPSTGTGGTPSTGTGGTMSGTGGTASGTGGTVSGTGGSASGTGGSASGTGGSASGTGGSGAEVGQPETGGVDMSGSGGEFKITHIDHKPHPTIAGRLCFLPEAGANGPMGGDVSPKMDWSAPPEGTKSLAITWYDRSNSTPHQIICNISADLRGLPANQGTKIPMGAQASTGHNKPGNHWYGPGTSVHEYEVTIWALSTPMLEGGCGTSGGGPTRMVYNKLKNAPKTLVLASDQKVLWGAASGNDCGR